MNLRQRFNALTPFDWAALALLLLYVVVFSTLTIRQHQAFNTNALDLAKFDQSIWSTSQFRPYAITIGENFVIQSHFSPALALFAPLYWLWDDIRILFVVQSLLLGGAGFLIYLFFRKQNPWLGLVVFAAYLMHPSLHQVNLMEFRRLTLAVFATSFATYHLLKRQYGWMALGLALALLSKEDMSLTAIAFGLYILLIQRQWKVGLTTFLVGAAWFVLVPFVLLPNMMTHDSFEGYQHAGSYFGYLGDSLPQILQTIGTDPAVLLTHAGDWRRWQAMGDFLWPTAFLFVLAPELALFMLPHLGYLMLSSAESMGRLQAWYPSVLLVMLFWAVAVGVARLSKRWQRVALVVLLLASAVGWLLQSELWPGPKWYPDRFAVTDEDRAMEDLLATIPQDAIVMAQDPLVPHLSHREDIYLYPWVRGGNQPDYLVLHPNLRSYPVEPDPFRSQFYDVVAGTEYAIDAQVDELMVFRYDPDAAWSRPQMAQFGDELALLGLDVASAEIHQPFAPVAAQMEAGTQLRVALLWEALAEMPVNYTVFVHLVDGDGNLLVQDDSWPADGFRPTSVLPVGERVRDIHMLQVPISAESDTLFLRIGIYEATTGDPLPLANGEPFLLLPLIESYR